MTKSDIKLPKFLEEFSKMEAVDCEIWETFLVVFDE